MIALKAAGLAIVPVRKAEPVMLPPKAADKARALPKLLLPGTALYASAMPFTIGSMAAVRAVFAGVTGATR